jgi:high-affinity iron transporter
LRSDVIGNLLIGLREGLEAVLVVSVLVAYLVKSDRRSQLPLVWFGTGLAVAVSLGFGALLTFGPRGLSDQGEEAIAGSLSVLAVVFVTWMIFWMAKASRTLATDLRAHVDASGSTPISLVLIAALAVGREGLETALFLWAATRSAIRDGVPTSEPLIGGLIGIAVAIGLGYALYAGAVRINLSKFFSITGGALILVAAGVLASGVRDLQDSGILPGAHAIAYDVSAVIPPESVAGSLLKGILNFAPDPTVLGVVVWVGYVVVVGAFFVRRVTRRRPVLARADSETASV